jgi:hypothetical protein
MRFQRLDLRKLQAFQGSKLADPLHLSGPIQCFSEAVKISSSLIDPGRSRDGSAPPARRWHLGASSRGDGGPLAQLMPYQAQRTRFGVATIHGTLMDAVYRGDPKPREAEGSSPRLRDSPSRPSVPPLRGETGCYVINPRHIIGDRIPSRLSSVKQ